MHTTPQAVHTPQGSFSLQRLRARLIGLLPGADRRIVYCLVGGLLLCLWGFVGVWSWWERSTLLASNAQVLAQLSTVVQEQTRAIFKQAETSLIVARHWMSEHPDIDPGTAPSFISLVNELRQTSDGLLDLRMVTRDGTLRYIPDLGQTGRTNVSDRDYFQTQFSQKTRDLFVAQPVVGRVTGKLSIPISIPVAIAGGDIAIILVAIELDRIAGSFEAERIKPRGTIAMFRSDGLFLFRSPMDAKIIGTSLGQSAIWSEHMGAHPQGQYQTESGSVDGLPRMVAYARVQDYPLVVAVSVVVDDVLGDWRLHTQLVVLAASLISLLAVLLGSTLLRTLKKEELVRRRLEHLMLTDPLTGVGNRRMLELRLDDEILRAQRYRRALTAVYFDLDHFKRVNDTYGHDIGDAVLRRVADSLLANVRQSDHVARIGGEEFVVLLTETSVADAVALVERMRAAVAELQVPGLPTRVTVSAGLAQWHEGENAVSLLRRADQALYRAKEAGRNSAFAALDA